MNGIAGIAATSFAAALLGLSGASLAQTSGAAAGGSGTSAEARCAGLSGTAMEKCEKDAQRAKDTGKFSGGDTGQSPGSGKDKPRTKPPGDG